MFESKVGCLVQFRDFFRLPVENWLFPLLNYHNNSSCIQITLTPSHTAHMQSLNTKNCTGLLRRLNPMVGNFASSWSGSQRLHRDLLVERSWTQWRLRVPPNWDGSVIQAWVGLSHQKWINRSVTSQHTKDAPTFCLYYIPIFWRFFFSL